MKKEFNITGVCYPHIHYMMDNSGKLREIMKLIEAGNNFTINRPRQYGKTTTLYFLTDMLTKSTEYLPIELSFQGVDEMWHESDKAFAQMFVNHLQKALKFSEPKLATFLKELSPTIQDMDTLSDTITAFVHQVPQKLVLLIDEVDASSNYLPFLIFLGMLRTKYLARFRAQHATFHSIVLAGVHDIKSLKYKLRKPEDAQYNSPWNIAIDFEVSMNFQPKEIAPMLVEYCEEEGVTMDIPAIAERLYYHTSGYPFLVSKLCRTIATKILPKRGDKSWTLKDVEESVQLLLKENNTNFDSLINNLENNQDLYDLAYQVIIEGLEVPFNPDEPVTSIGRMYGIFKANGRLKIHNRIYEQRLYNYMTAKTFRLISQQRKYHFDRDSFINDDNSLDLEQVLVKFQEFMKEQRSSKDKEFIERQWRLIFLAFLKPIISGKGHDFKEVETSDEKRLDIVVTFYEQKYILELKIWRGVKNHEKGIKQLVNYLDIHSVDKGHLLIFDTRKKKTWEMKSISYQGKEIFAAWV